MVSVFFLVGCGTKNPAAIKTFKEAYEYYNQQLDTATQKAKKDLETKVKAANGDFKKLGTALIDASGELTTVVTEANEKFMAILQSPLKDQEEYKKWFDKLSKDLKKETKELSDYFRKLTRTDKD